MKLLDICEAIVDCPHSTAKDEGKGYPLIRTPNVGKGRLKLDGVHRVSEQVYNQRNERAVPQVDDLILAREAPVGNVAIIRQGQKVCLGQRTVLIRPNKKYVDPDFLVYYLLSPELQHKLLSSSNGATVSHLNMSSIRSLEVQAPDIEIQKRIGAILARIDDKIELNTAINEKLEQQAQALFKNLIADIQERVPFTSVIQVLGGGTPKTGKQEYWNGEIPFFTPKDVGAPYVLTTEKSITPLGLDNCNSRLYPVNTVFLTARGTVGKVSLAGVPMSMNQSCYALAGKDGLHQIIVYHYVLETVKALKHKASGAVFDAIITRDFDTESVPALSSEQIDGFIAVAEPIYSDILNRTIENQRLAALRDTLLPKLMSGEIDVSAVRI